MHQVSGVGRHSVTRCQVSNVEDSGVRCQVSGKRNIEAETCWSEAEIPSEAKRQRGTLKPQDEISPVGALHETISYQVFKNMNRRTAESACGGQNIEVKNIV